LLQETVSLKEVVKRLEHLVAELNHVVHGKKSEKLSEDDRQLAFEDLQIAVSEAEEQKQDQAPTDDAPRRKSSSARRNRGNLPESLPRIEQVVEPDSLEWSPLRAPLVRATMATRLRADAQDRGGPHRAARHRAGATSRAGHGSRQELDVHEDAIGGFDDLSDLYLDAGTLDGFRASAGLTDGQWAENEPSLRQEMRKARRDQIRDLLSRAESLEGYGCLPAAGS